MLSHAYQTISFRKLIHCERDKPFGDRDAILEAYILRRTEMENHV
jgi:hypothetical protein